MAADPAAAAGLMKSAKSESADPKGEKVGRKEKRKERDE